MNTISPRSRVLYIPPLIEVSETGGAAAPVSWWLSGGVSAANAIGVYQPIGAASLAASYVNLANPGTYDAAPGTAPTFNAATGWGFDFTGSQYLTTGIVLGKTWTQIVRFSDASGASGRKEGYLYGALTNLARYFGIAPYGHGDANIVTYAQGNYVQIAPKTASGVLAIAGLQPYRNGSPEGSTIAAGGTATTNGAYIGALNGGVGYYLTGKIQALAIYNTTLSAPQVAAISAAMAAL